MTLRMSEGDYASLVAKLKKEVLTNEIGLFVLENLV